MNYEEFDKMDYQEISKLIYEDLNISISSLEVEWEKQASNYYKWSELLAEAQRRKMNAKMQLDNIEAKIDLDIRSNPAKFNLGKSTEAAIRNIIINSEGYMTDHQQYLNLVKKNDLLQAAVRALEHKKSALENLQAKK